MNTSEFVESMKITAKSRRVDSNPGMDANMDHWRVTLRYMPGPGGAITVPFSKGYGHHGAEPTAAEVLSCLADDAAGFENARSFEEWAEEYGYDTDSRKAERIYKACERIDAKLHAWLGNQAQVLLWDVERD